VIGKSGTDDWIKWNMHEAGFQRISSFGGGLLRGQRPLNLPMTGQLSNHFVEGMRKIYELEPFIKMESSLPDEHGKGSKIYKRAI
jgi:hypothetical protein